MSHAFPRSFLFALVALACLPGCGFVHFGRMQAPASTNPALIGENTDLRMEKNLLQQELAIAHREGKTLRDALGNRSDVSGSQGELAQRLNEASRELSVLREDYARLQGERERSTQGPPDSLADLEQIADLKTQLSVAESKFARAVKENLPLQQENNQLRQEVNRVRQENSGLTEQVQTLMVLNEQASTALAQLNSELTAQREARQHSEDLARANGAQLKMVLAQRKTAQTAESLAEDSTAVASEIDATLRIDQEVKSDKSSTAVLRTSQARLDNVVNYDGKYTKHLVAEGETLESIARKYYGRPEPWRQIYAANNTQLRGGRPLKAGMTIIIPLD